MRETKGDFMVLDDADLKILLMLMKKSIEFSRLGFADQKVLSWFLTHSPHRVKSWVDYLAEDYTSSRATPIDGIKLYDELSICYNEEPFFERNNSMHDMIFTPELTGHLKLISKAVEEFTKDGIKKSEEQFAAEIEAIKNLLDEAKEKTGNSIMECRVHEFSSNLSEILSNKGITETP